jgi:hypothetical protein
MRAAGLRPAVAGLSAVLSGRRLCTAPGAAPHAVRVHLLKQDKVAVAAVPIPLTSLVTRTLTALTSLCPAGSGGHVPGRQDVQVPRRAAAGGVALRAGPWAGAPCRGWSAGGPLCALRPRPKHLNQCAVAGPQVVAGRRHVGLMAAEPVGNYGAHCTVLCVCAFNAPVCDAHRVLALRAQSRVQSRL